MKTSQSRILTLLSVVQMWKFFSHFGVRTLLVLYMVEHLHYSDKHAFGVNAVFCGLTQLGAIFGGMMADRYLGLRRATLIGGWLLGLGYLGLLVEEGLFWAMGLIIAGGSLFSSNMTALLGLNYAENDPQRKKGFTLFFMMQNLGALISTLICGFVALRYGFRLAFAIASLGMGMGNLLMFLYRDLLQNLGEIPKKGYQILLPIVLCTLIFVVGSISVGLEKVVLWLLPWLACGLLLFFMVQLLKDKRCSKEQVYKLSIYLGAIVLFFAVEDQICSSLILFAERETDRVFLGWTLPSSIIASINPLVILLCGALIAKKQVQIITPFILSAGAFGIMALFCLTQSSFPIWGVMGMALFISMAELMIAPLVLSHTSEIAAKGNPGIVMGMVPIAFSLAYQLSGGISQMVAIENRDLSLEIYGVGFGAVALLMLCGGSLLQLAMRRFSSEKNSVC